MTAFKLGTRGSKLAMWQAEWVKRALAGAGVAAELVIIKTRGDAEVDRPLHELEGKGACPPAWCWPRYPSGRIPPKRW